MTNLDKIIKKYQGLLVEEYREKHPIETEGLTDAEVYLMNPITKADINFIKQLIITKLKEEIKGLREEIKNDEAALNDPKTWKESITEIRADIRDANIKLGTLLANIDFLEDELKEEETLEDDNGFGSR